jgi:hypothetical protein
LSENRGFLKSPFPCYDDKNHGILGDDLTHFDPYSHPMGFQWASVVNPWVSEDFINLGNRSDLSRWNYI